MNIDIYNDVVRINQPSEDLIEFVKDNLCYTDKSKQYQIKRLSRSVWKRNDALIKKLEKESKGNLYRIDGATLEIHTGLLHLVSDLIQGHDLEDHRKETGKTVSLPWSEKPHDLRPYQEDAITEMMASRKGLVNFATGLGKTLVATHLTKRLRLNTLVVCPSESVAKQFYDVFVAAFGKTKVGFYGDGKKKINDLTIGIAASIVRSIDDFYKEDFGLIIMDEVHHCPANTFFEIASKLSKAGRFYGLTATDYRSDGKDIMITAGCGPVLIRRDIKWGVENGWLAEPYFIVREIDTKGRDFKDDKLKSYKEHVLNCSVMKNRIYSDARSMIDSGKSVLVLVDEVAHGKELSEQLGIPFATGQDSKSQDYVDLLNKGKIPGLVGTDGKISEGTDTKNVDVLIMANFTASKGPVIQAVGRGLRKQGTKTKCLILDYVPKGSSMLSRHAYNRLSFYRQMTDKVKLVKL
jgi:superfamily II DNA or RNA helicase